MSRNEFAAMTANLAKLSAKELEQLENELAAKKTAAREVEIAAAREKIEKIMEQAGATLREIFPRKPGGERPAREVVYVCPTDATKTWSGKGPQPGWFKDALARGIAREDMKPKDSTEIAA